MDKVASFSISDAARRSTRTLAVMESDVLVTLGVAGSKCEVVLSDGSLRQTMPCREVVSYLTSTLKLPRGATFEVKTIPDVSEDEYDALMSGLKAAGFRRAPGIHVGFLTEPNGK